MVTICFLSSHFPSSLRMKITNIIIQRVQLLYNFSYLSGLYYLIYIKYTYGQAGYFWILFQQATINVCRSFVYPKNHLLCGKRARK